MVEKYFSDGLIKVLVCTSTLAWGVNLPAHAVVIRVGVLSKVFPFLVEYLLNIRLFFPGNGNIRCPTWFLRRSQHSRRATNFRSSRKTPIRQIWNRHHYYDTRQIKSLFISPNEPIPYRKQLHQIPGR